ncbi:ATP-binding protein DrrA1-3 family domain-containing protein [Desulfocucumis palustris]
MWKKIRALALAGTTVFLTTQYLEEAEQLVDQIAILHKGKIIVQGTAAELKKLLPHGYIELRFHQENAAQTALKVLNTYQANFNEEAMAITVTTDGSARQMADVLNRLEDANVPVAEFSQKLPTLEDVFLALVDNKQKEAK